MEDSTPYPQRLAPHPSIPSGAFGGDTRGVVTVDTLASATQRDAAGTVFASIVPCSSPTLGHYQYFSPNVFGGLVKIRDKLSLKIRKIGSILSSAS